MDKKLLIISMYPKNEAPYAQLYIDACEKANKDYEIIYWNRYETKKKEVLGNEIIYNLECPNGGYRLQKVFKMLRYALFIRKNLKKNIYDKVIILTTVPGIFTFDILAKKYKNCYIFDIRDYTNEGNSIYYLLEKKVINNSFSTVISSKGFEQFLPKKNDYQIAHNISNYDKVSNENQLLFKKDKIVIGFVGNVRYEKENMELINLLKIDRRFEIGYWGNINKNLIPDKLTSQNENVVFHGKYSNAEKPNIYRKIDFINAIYGNSSLEVTTAIPNRLYDALMFKKPILTSKGTLLGEIVEKNKIGIAINFADNDNYNYINSFIENFNQKEFEENCNKLLSIYLKEQNELKKHIDNFLNTND